MDAGRRVLGHIERGGRWARGSDDGVVGSEADPAGELLQQARDGAGRAGRRGLETDCGAVGGQEDFPHRLQTGLALGGEGTPGEESRGGGVQKTGREEGYGREILYQKRCGGLCQEITGGDSASTP